MISLTLLTVFKPVFAL